MKVVTRFLDVVRSKAGLPNSDSTESILARLSIRRDEMTSEDDEFVAEVTKKLGCGQQLEQDEMDRLASLLVAGRVTEQEVKSSAETYRKFFQLLSSAAKAVSRANEAKRKGDAARRRKEALEEELRAVNKDLVDEHYSGMTAGSALAQFGDHVRSHPALFADIGDPRGLVEELAKSPSNTRAPAKVA
jgi:phosphoenolpyruvate carboxylase